MAVQSIRDLFVSIGFDVDDRDLRSLNNRIEGVKSAAIGLRNLFFGATGLTAGLGFFVKEAANMEEIEQAFEALTKDADLAKETIADLQKFIKETPFEFKETISLAKNLLASDFAAKDLVKTMKVLGDISAAVGKEKLPFIVAALRQVKNSNRLLAEETNRFSDANVNLRKALQKTLGVSADEFKKLQKEGKITFEQVFEALESLTKEGGLFFNFMSKLASTFNGILSSIKDSLTFISIGIGKELLPEAKKLAIVFKEYLELNQEIIKTKIVKFIASFVKVLKLAILALLGFIGIQVLGGLGSMVLLILKLNSALFSTSKLLLLNKAIMLALPFLIGLAIATLIAVITDLRGFFEGKKSVTGLILDFFGKKFPQETEAAKLALEGINDNFKDLQSFLGNIKNLAVGLITFDREKINKNLAEIRNEVDVTIQAIKTTLREDLGIKVDLNFSLKTLETNLNNFIKFVKDRFENIINLDIEALKVDIAAMKLIFQDLFDFINKQFDITSKIEEAFKIQTKRNENILLAPFKALGFEPSIKLEEESFFSKITDFFGGLSGFSKQQANLVSFPALPNIPSSRSQNITNTFGNISVSVPVTNNNGNLNEQKIAEMAASEVESQIDTMLRNANASTSPAVE